ncbi:MAG: PQQ-dependent sugar dehydrogenase [Polyangiaceae bacterium]
MGSFGAACVSLAIACGGSSATLGDGGASEGDASADGRNDGTAVNDASVGTDGSIGASRDGSALDGTVGDASDAATDSGKGGDAGIDGSPRDAATDGTTGDGGARDGASDGTTPTDAGDPSDANGTDAGTVDGGDGNDAGGADGATGMDAGGTGTDAGGGSDAAVGPECELGPMKLTAVVSSGLTDPLFVTAPAGDSRLFVVEKGGTVRIVRNGALLPTPFVTVADVFVPDPGSEGGLLGMAFHPDYATNGRFYLHSTRAPNGRVVVREFRVSTNDPDVADPTPVKTFLDAPHGGYNHVGGMLAFGADGKLYAGVGDAASSANARDLTSPLGKLLRFDVDLHPAAPDGNMTGADVNPYVWAYGLRNPWRFSFDRSRASWMIGDVGQNAYEEIDVAGAAESGVDYGWDVMEGTHCRVSGCSPVGRAPIVEHAHASDEASSIIGGYVYRGANLRCLRGRYVYGDYVTSRIFSFVPDGQNAPTERVELSSELNPAGSPAARIVSFGEDGAGELYVVNVFPGRVFRIDAE